LRHHASPGFWKSFAKLPVEVQALARRNFELLKRDPRHPSLHFKKVGRYWSVRIGSDFRALGKPVDGGVLWGWIGSHAEYDSLL
jgi:hypothetical protein